MTRLDTLSLSDVRGFYRKQRIILAKPNGKNGSGLTVIVGPNNSGKTTVIEGFKKFFQGSPPQFDIEERHKNRDVILAIKNTDGESKILKTNGGSVGSIDHPEYYPQANNFYFISSRRYFETYFGTSQLNHNQHRISLINISKSGIDSHFGQRMIAIDADQQQKAKFKVRVQEKVIFNIDEQVVEKEIINKNAKELEDYFVNNLAIDKVKVTFWPFWVRRVPAKNQGLNLKIVNALD